MRLPLLLAINGATGFTLRIPSILGRSRHSNAVHAVARSTPPSTRLPAVSSPVDVILPQTDDAEKEKAPQFEWTKQWYPLRVAEYTDKTKPHAVQLLGRELVLWSDGSAWRCYEDACPHRFAALSEGRIEGEQLLCAYHAWRFAGPEGRCVDIPQSPAAAKEKHMASPKACAKSYPVTEKQGLIFVWPESGPQAEAESLQRSPSFVPEAEDPELIKSGRLNLLPFNHRDLPYGWDAFFENILDPAHVPVSHHGLVGNRYTDAKPLEYNVRRRPDTQNGFSFEPLPLSDTVLSSCVDFQPPSHTLITTTFKDGAKTMLSLFCAPTVPGRSQHIGRQILIKSPEGKTPAGLAFFSLPLPAWLQHCLASLFLHQDLVFLAAQQRLLQNGGVSSGNFHEKIYTPNGQDKGILLFRRWLAKSAGGGVPWPSFLDTRMPRLSKRELFDVYDTHTKHCTSCTAAAKNFTKAINVLRGAAVSALLAATLQKSVIPLLALAVVTGGASVALDKFKTLFHVYEFEHQAND